MMNTIRSEFIKIRTVRVHWVLAIIGLALPIALIVLFAVFVSLFDLADRSRTVTDFIVGSSALTGLLLSAMAAISLTSEYGHNTIRPTYAATPTRFRVHGAKLIVISAVLALMGAVVIFAGWFITQLIVVLRDGSLSLGDPEVLSRLISGVVAIVLVGWFGFALGLVIRNSAATVTIVLLWQLLVEAIIGGLLFVVNWDGAAKWLPYSALRSATASAFDESDDQLGRPWGLVYFAAVSLVLIALGAFVDNRRDA